LEIIAWTAKRDFDLLYPEMPLFADEPERETVAA